MSKKKTYRVIKTFKDKHSLTLYNVNDLYESDAKRTKELVTLGYIKEAKDVKDGSGTS